MRQHKLVIPGVFPTLNELIDMSKRHWAEYAKIKKTNTHTVAWIAKKLPKMERIYLDITWYCKDRRKDLDNISAGIKFLLDGLVEAGVIPNDGWGEVAGFSHSFAVDKQNPRVEVVIEEVEA